MVTIRWCLFLGILSACSNNGENSKAKEVEDISSMSQRGDGSFDVRCLNGQSEIRNASEIRRGNVCTQNGGSTGSLICVSRDSDGQSPWVIARLEQSGQLQRLPGTQFSTIETCQASTAGAITWQNNLLICSSRDNDGQDPWIVNRVPADGSSVRIVELQYSKFEQCQSSLKVARTFPEAVIMCGSRDRDGNNPWNLYRITMNATTRLDLVFGTLPECLGADQRPRN